MKSQGKEGKGKLMTLESDCCHRLYPRSSTNFYNLKDNEILCEHCSKELFDSDLSDDYINYKGE
jgi:hypothetical protein